jgi:cell division septation protein DedD
MEILAILLIAWVLSDAALRGKPTAAAKGAARTGGRAAAASVRTHRDGHRAYLASGRAPLGRTRLAAADSARAVGRGTLDGARAELAALRDDIARARVEADAERLARQDPAVGVTLGRGGHSFDLPPADPAAPVDTAPAWRRHRPAPVPRETPDPATAPADTGTPAPAAPTAAPTAAATPPPPDPSAAPATETTTATTPPTGEEGTVTMTAMSTTGSGGPSVEVRSIPGFITACDQIAALIVNVSEQATGFGLAPDAQAGLSDAGDVMRAVAQSARDTYARLVEAADATPTGAAEVKVGAARTE